MTRSDWVWLRTGDGRRVLAFCYTDPMAGPSAKGGVVSDPPRTEEIRAAIDHPTQTFREPERFSPTAIGAEEQLRLGLPKDPPWIGFFDGRPVPPPRGEPSRTVRVAVVQQGQPVTKAKVTLGELIRQSFLPLDERRTDATGVVEFPLAPTTPVHVIAQTKTCGSKLVPVPDEGNVTLDLLGLSTLEGRTTRAGNPTRGVVSLVGRNGGRYRLEYGEHDGSYRIEGLVPDTYDVTVHGVHPVHKMLAGTPTFAVVEVAPNAKVPRDFELVAGVTVSFDIGLRDMGQRVNVVLFRGNVAPTSLEESRALQQELGPSGFLSANWSEMDESRAHTELLDVTAGEYTAFVCFQGGPEPFPVICHRVVVGQEDVAVQVEWPSPGEPPDANRIVSEIRIGERLLAFEMRADGQSRLLVDGRTIPMTLARKETTVSGAGHYYTKETPATACRWVDLGSVLRHDPRWSVDAGPPVTLSCEARTSAEIFNTVVYDSLEVTLTLPADLSSVAIVMSEHSDGST
ncbi:MAG: hypothetical protein R3B13_16305 [Polyangiaceae bacterium]